MESDWGGGGITCNTSEYHLLISRVGKSPEITVLREITPALLVPGMVVNMHKLLSSRIYSIPIPSPVVNDAIEEFVQLLLLLPSPFKLLEVEEVNSWTRNHSKIWQAD